MKEHLLLVDGSNLLFQMFYGMPARIVNYQNKPIFGTIGFVGALLKIIQQVKPTHVAVLFDGEHQNSRNSIDAMYKANRPYYSAMPPEETPFYQLNDICTALDCLKICHGLTTECEVDDWIASYVQKYQGQIQITISSWDSDYFQLVSNGVYLLQYRGKKTQIYTPVAVLNRFGVLPNQYADYKAMVGDKADNIAGVQGIGPKTAARLLAKYGNLQQVIAQADFIGTAVGSKIKSAAEKLQVNYRLIKLSGQCDAPFDLQQLTYTPCRLGTMDVLRQIKLIK